MLNLRNLMDFLPYYYREADTYKVSGKGILERYLEIFGNYFEDYIVADTKNILDILDIDNCPEIYLNYLWEFLGQMPFAYGCNIDAEKWSMYFNGFDSDEKITELSHLWIIPKDSNDNFNLSPDQVRKFLKYSISLFKIRGTQRFFEILFKMYGLTCEIGLPQSDSFMDPTGNTSSDYYGSDDDYAGSDNEEDNDDEDYGGRDLYVSRYVSTKLDIEDNCLDECTLDKRSTCTKCITLPVTITGHSFDSEDIYEENFVQFQKICEAIFDRFLPYNVQADINYGFIIPCTYHIATYLKEGDQWLFLKSDTSKNVTNLAKLYLQDNIIRELQIKVLVSRTYRNRDDLKFRVGSITQVEPGETPQIKTLSETEHISTDIIHITRSLDGSDYLLYSSEPNSDGTHTQVNLSVIRKVVVKEYTLEAHTVQGTFILSPEHPYLQLNVTSSVSIDNHPYPVRYRDLDTGEIHNSGTGFIISSPKLYRFGLVDFPLKQIEVNITRVPEKLSIICTPVSNTLNLPNEIVKTHVIVEGDYDNVEFDRTAIVIQAMTSGGNIIDNLALENYYIVSGESPNVVASTICGHGSIPILDNDHATEVIEPIEAIRICHLKNIIRKTSQSLVIHTRKVVGGTVTHQYTNLLSQITYHKGRISSSTTPPSPVSDSDYVYSDWIPVSEYQDGFTSESTPKPINCLEYHLLCSKFKYYEISNRSIQYNSGEYFETSSPGSFIFRPLLESDFEIDPEYSQASYVVNSNVDSDVQYGINVNPLELTYQDVMGQTYTKAVNAVITVSTNLEFAEGLRRDSLNPLNFKVYIYSRADWEDSTPGHVPTYKKVIYPNDSGWVVNTQSSKYEKYISVMFTDGSGDDSDFPAQGIISDGKYVLVLDPNNIMSGYTKSKTILLLNYVDPNRDYIALVPYIASDPGWSNKDWSKDNTYATWYPNLAYQNSNYLSVRIQGSDGSLSGYGTVNVYQVIDSVETLVQTFEVGTRPSSINNNTAGLYRLRVNNGTSDSTLYAQLVISNMNITYSIECSPSSAYQSDFSTIKVSVYGKVNDFSVPVPPENLYVRRVGENIWYPSGHLFLIVAPGTDTTYTFQLKGDPSQTCTFTYLVAPPQT